MKIPFDIKYRPQIESGEYKVETRNGLPVRIICWDRKYGYPIVGLAYEKATGCESYVSAYEDGTTSANGKMELSDDLFIVTPYEELTEFEKELESFYNHHLQVCSYDNQGTVEDSLHYGANKILTIAKEELVRQGYVIEKKAFHDAVEKVDSVVIKDVSAHIDFENLIHNLGKRYPEVSFAKLARIAKVAYQKGREEALKDLPRWEKLIHPTVGPVALIKTWNGGYRIDNHIEPGDSFIHLSMLETLPGFKEEDCHE